MMIKNSKTELFGHALSNSEKTNQKALSDQKRRVRSCWFLQKEQSFAQLLRSKPRIVLIIRCITSSSYFITSSKVTVVVNVNKNSLLYQS